MASASPDDMEPIPQDRRPICGARTRRGTPCRRPAGPDGRCWMHADPSDNGQSAQGPEGHDEPAADDRADSPVVISPVPQAPLPVPGKEDAPEMDDLIEVDIESDLAGPSPLFGHLSSEADIPIEEIDIEEIEAALGDEVSPRDTDFEFSGDMDPEVTENTDPGIGIDLDIVTDDEVILPEEGESGGGFENSGQMLFFLDDDDLPDSDDAPGDDLFGSELAGPVGAAEDPEALSILDDDEPMLEIATDFQEAEAPEPVLEMDTLSGPDDDEPMLEIAPDFQEAEEPEPVLEMDTLSGPDDDEPMLEIATDFAETQEMEAPPAMAGEPVPGMDPDLEEAVEPEPALEIQVSLETNDAGPELVLEMEEPESVPDSDAPSAENDFDVESPMEAEFSLEMTEEEAHPEEMASQGFDAEPETPAQEGEDGDDAFDLSFGIEIEGVPFAADVFREAEPEVVIVEPGTAGDAPDVADATPTPERAWWKRTVRVPVFLFVAAALFAGIGFGLMALWGKQGPDMDLTAALSVIDPTGVIVENIHHGPVFVIRGQVRNDAGSARRRIVIRGRLYTRSGFVKTATVYGGHDLSEAELAAMPPVPLLERLADPRRNPEGDVRLDAGQTLPFTIIFTDLPADLSGLDKFAVAVTRASP